MDWIYDVTGQGGKTSSMGGWSEAGMGRPLGVFIKQREKKQLMEGKREKDRGKKRTGEAFSKRSKGGTAV